MRKIRKISSKSSSLNNGSSIKALISNLNSSTSLVMGLLATLSLRHHSLWIKKYKTTRPEHLRILLQEVMEENLIQEQLIMTLKMKLANRYKTI